MTVAAFRRIIIGYIIYYKGIIAMRIPSSTEALNWSASTVVKGGLAACVGYCVTAVCSSVSPFAGALFAGVTFATHTVASALLSKNPYTEDLNFSSKLLFKAIPLAGGIFAGTSALMITGFALPGLRELAITAVATALLASALFIMPLVAVKTYSAINDLTMVVKAKIEKKS